MRPSGRTRWLLSGLATLPLLSLLTLALAGCGEDKPTGAYVPQTTQDQEATKNMEEFMRSQEAGKKK